MKDNMLKILAMRAKNRLMNREDAGKRIKIINNDDSEFVNKVRTLLAKEEINRAPMKSLMDEKQLLGLGEQAKERYLLETMEKYLKAKALIESENYNSAI